MNLKATFFCCQQAALLMKKTGAGRIVNLSSLGGIRPWDMYAHYCASKAGVIMLTRALAKAFAPEITVNSVAPGVILASSEDPRAQDLIAATPAQRSGTPEEIADAVLYFHQRVELRHRASAGGGWRPEPALSQRSLTSRRRLLDGDFGALGGVLRQMVDTRVQHAAHPLQHFDAGVAEMLARVLRPDVIQKRVDLRRGDVAEETSALMYVDVRPY